MDRIIFVTGGTGALGSAVASVFLDSGDRVVVTYRKQEEFRALSERAGDGAERLRGLVTDVTDAESVRGAVDTIVSEYGRVDALIHVAGGYVDSAPVSAMDDATWDRMMNLNLRSAFVCARAILPHMIERRRGKIITIGSRAAERVYAGIGAYAASKAGLVALTEVISAEVADRNIQANVVLPSIIDTEVNRAAMPKADFSTWVRPEEIAAVIAFLASPAADAITGAAIPVFGRA